MKDAQGALRQAVFFYAVYCDRCHTASIKTTVLDAADQAIDLLGRHRGPLDSPGKNPVS